MQLLWPPWALGYLKSKVPGPGQITRQPVSQKGTSKQDSGSQGPMTLRFDHSAVTHAVGGVGMVPVHDTVSKRRIPSFNNLSFIDAHCIILPHLLCHATLYHVNVDVRKKNAIFQRSLTSNTRPHPRRNANRPSLLAHHFTFTPVKPVDTNKTDQ